MKLRKLKQNTIRRYVCHTASTVSLSARPTKWKGALNDGDGDVCLSVCLSVCRQLRIYARLVY